jgi:hypothetical protein
VFRQATKAGGYVGGICAILRGSVCFLFLVIVCIVSPPGVG